MYTFIKKRIFGIVVVVYSFGVIIYSPAILRWEKSYGVTGNWAAAAIFGIAATMVFPYWLRMLQNKEGSQPAFFFALTATFALFCIQQTYLALI